MSEEEILIKLKEIKNQGYSESRNMFAGIDGKTECRCCNELEYIGFVWGKNGAMLGLCYKCREKLKNVDNLIKPYLRRKKLERILI